MKWLIFINLALSLLDDRWKFEDVEEKVYTYIIVCDKEKIYEAGLEGPRLVIALFGNKISFARQVNDHIIELKSTVPYSKIIERLSEKLTIVNGSIPQRVDTFVKVYLFESKGKISEKALEEILEASN